MTNDYGSDVAVIDTSTNTVTATIPIGGNALGITITPNGARAYAANAADNNVSVIDTASNTVPVGPVGIGPNYIAFAVRTQGPTGKDQCKQGGWQTFTNPKFKNQGDCVSFVNHMNHSQ